MDPHEMQCMDAYPGVGTCPGHYGISDRQTDIQNDYFNLHAMS